MVITLMLRRKQHNTGSGTQTDADNSVVNVDKSITNVISASK